MVSTQDAIEPPASSELVFQSRAPRAPRVVGNQVVVMAVIYAVFVVCCVVWVPHFASRGNVGDILAAAPVIGVAALGQCLVMISGGLDLSIGQLAALAGILSVGLVSSASELLWAIPMAIGIGIGTGLFNGVVVAVARVNPIISTFGMYSVLQGAAYMYSQTSVGRTQSAVAWIDERRLLGMFPVSFLVFLALAAVAWIVYSRTAFGTHIRAVGSNEANALRSGIPVTRIKVLVYLIAGVCGAMVGLILAARLRTGYPGAGAGIELSSIVAVLIGGTAYGGGRGTIVGTVLGVLTLATVSNVLNLRAVGSEIQDVTTGLIVVGAVVIYTARRKGG